MIKKILLLIILFLNQSNIYSQFIKENPITSSLICLLTGGIAAHYVTKHYLNKKYTDSKKKMTINNKNEIINKKDKVIAHYQSYIQNIHKKVKSHSPSALYEIMHGNSQSYHENASKLLPNNEIKITIHKNKYNFWDYTQQSYESKSV